MELGRRGAILRSAAGGTRRALCAMPRPHRGDAPMISAVARRRRACADL